MLRESKLRAAAEKYIPGWVVIPLVYLIGLLYIVLLIISSPLIFLYCAALCVGAWFVLPNQGKDVLVVRHGKSNFDPWLSQVMPIVEDRALFLDYETRESWPRWSIPVKLFHTFGPTAKPVSSLPDFLPSVIVVRKFHWPTQFDFGARSLYKETNLEKLRSALGLVSD